MKKIMMTLAAVLCCAMTTTVITACGGDDDKNNSPSTHEVVGYQINYSLDFPKETTQTKGLSGNLYLLCDKIEVAYLDDNGKEQREVVTNGKWSKSVTYKHNLEGYLKLYLTKPANLNVESLPYERYTNSVTVYPTQFGAGISTLYSDGTKDSDLQNIQIFTLVTERTIPTSSLQSYFDTGFKNEVTIVSIDIKM